MFLRLPKRHLVPSRSSTPFRRSHADLAPVPLVKPTVRTKPEIAIILKLSEALPKTMDSKQRDTMGVRLWTHLTTLEQREILDAHRASAQSVRKSPNGSPIDFISNQVSEPECWVDASTKHACIAVIINKTYVTFNLTKGWDKEATTRNIHWAEAVGIELAARAMVTLGYSGTRARIHTDSLIALQAFSGTLLKNLQQINESANRSQKLLAKANIMVNYIRVPSKENIADGFSRGKFDSGYSRLACDIPLPAKLTPLLRVAP